MIHWFKRCGVRFAEHPWIMRKMQRGTRHENGGRLKIKYLTPKSWGKRYRDRELTKAGRTMTVNAWFPKIADGEGRFPSPKTQICIPNK